MADFNQSTQKIVGWWILGKQESRRAEGQGRQAGGLCREWGPGWENMKTRTGWRSRQVTGTDRVSGKNRESGTCRETRGYENRPQTERHRYAYIQGRRFGLKIDRDQGTEVKQSAHAKQYIQTMWQENMEQNMELVACIKQATKKNPAHAWEVEGQINPCFRVSWIYSSMVWVSATEKGYMQFHEGQWHNPRGDEEGDRWLWFRRRATQLPVSVRPPEWRAGGRLMDSLLKQNHRAHPPTLRCADGELYLCPWNGRVWWENQYCLLATENSIYFL